MGGTDEIARRMRLLRNAFVTGRTLTVAQGAKLLGVSEKTFMRDIARLRADNGLTLIYDPKAKTYRCDAFEDHLKSGHERDAIIFHALVKKIAENKEYFPVIYEPVLNQIRKHVSDEYRCLLDSISYETNEYEPVDTDTLTFLMEAIKANSTLSFSYIDSKGRTTARTVEPLHLVCYTGEWYCVGWDTGRKALRKFHVARIGSPALAAEPAAHRLTKREIADYLGESFGIYKSGTATYCSFRVYEPAYHIVRSQVWHRDQRLSEGVDLALGKFVEVTVPVGDYEELVGKILRYGRCAEARFPESFRRKWLDELEEMGRRYLGKMR